VVKNRRADDQIDGALDEVSLRRVDANEGEPRSGGYIRRDMVAQDREQVFAKIRGDDVRPLEEFEARQNRVARARTNSTVGV
jgi:hypothetical protein